MKYTAEDYIEFIESCRRDKISPDALQVIAKRFRQLEKEAKQTHQTKKEEGGQQ